MIRLLAAWIAAACLAAAAPAQDPAVAMVDGIPIRLSDVESGIPAETLGRMRAWASKMRLARLIDYRSVRQRLDAAGIAPEPAAVDAALARLRELPPTMACVCHSYRDFGDYLKQNLLTEREVRGDAEVEVGLRLWAEARWEAAHAGPEARARLLAERAEDVRGQWRHIWLLGFRRDISGEPGKDGMVKPRLEAATARRRLLAGERFEDLAAEHAKQRSNARGVGYLGIIDIHELWSRHGLDPAAFAGVPEDAVSEPIPGHGGYVIIRQRRLDDGEVVARIRGDAIEAGMRDFIATAMRERQVVYVGPGLGMRFEGAAPSLHRR